MILLSDLLRREGVLHGFSTREGGVSQPPFASLNLGGSVGDDPALVEENHRLLALAAGFPRSAFRGVRQVHGDRVLVAGAEPLDPAAEADALVGASPEAVVAVKTADCVPILLLDRSTGEVAAVHAGWRGTRAGIVARAVEVLASRGGSPAEMVAAIGPSIGRCCYEVSEELAAAFVAELGPRVAEGRRLDLVEANRTILSRAGVPASRVEQVGGCTACAPQRFFSHRRDHGRTGRHLSFIRSVS